MKITPSSFPKDRDRTRALIQQIQPRLADHIMAVKENFRPGALFGSAITGNKDVKDGPAAWLAFTKQFKEIAASLHMEPELPTSIEINSTTPALFPFSYRYALVDTDQPRKVMVKNGLRFVLSFPEYPFDALVSLAGNLNRKKELREAVLHYAVLNAVVMQNRRLLALFEDLAFPIRTEKVEGLGETPITTITAPVATVRPPDDVITLICEYSGADVIEEVADFEALAEVRHPYAERYGKPAGASA
jgi:hypothetical protein